jgi:hypothetical protein
MMIVFIIEIAGPYLEVVHKFLPHLYILIIDEGCEIIDVVIRLVEILNWDGVGIPETDQVLENEGIVFPETAPKDGS